MVRYCPQCGVDIPSNGASYCAKCGFGLDKVPIEDGALVSAAGRDAARFAPKPVLNQKVPIKANQPDKVVVKPARPSQMLQRFGRVSLQVGKLSLQIGLTVLVIVLLLLITGSFLFRRTVQRAISDYPWESYSFEVDKVNHYSETRLNEIAQKKADPVLENIFIDVRPPNRVDVSANWAGVFLFKLPLTVELVDQKPKFQATEINGIPFFFVTDNISRGINDGFDGALRDASVHISSLEIEDSAVRFEVIPNDD